MTNNVQTPGGNTTTAGAVEMARRIAWETVLRVEGTTRENMERAAFAAIIETSEAAAKLADVIADVGTNDPRGAGWEIAAAFRSFDHLKGQP